jgi:hypothetical protein
VRVKLTHNLQPHEQSAQSIILYDDMGNPIFVAMQLDESIIYADAGEPDFHAMLRALGVNKTVIVNEVTPKPVKNMLWTPGNA